MIFWIGAAVLAAIVTISVLWAVSVDSYGNESNVLLDSRMSNLSMYKNQLAEIDTDLARGMIDEEGAKEARLELSRAILAQEKQLTRGAFTKNRSKFLRINISLGVLFVPILMIGVYSLTGSPETKSYFFNDLMRINPQNLNLEQNLVRMEALFLRDPDNGKLADDLASSYLVAGRYQDSANTYLDALRLNGETAPRLVGYGMALSGFEGGTITQEAQKAFEKAVKLSPQDFYPRLFIAEALRQEGKADEAAKGLQNFLDQAPKDSPWRSRVEAMIIQLQQNAKDSSSMTQQNHQFDKAPSKFKSDEQVMIIGMVTSLEQRLKTDPDDLEGWKMLIHSWLVLKKSEKAQKAYNEGRNKLSSKKVDALKHYAKEQGLVVNQNGVIKTP
ncbi:c-type cytochrome biogenesis protein CcmI [Bartonella tamiae]|uniref:Cytochrome c-type biogenesis protein CcmI n=1 Tax=Bartonella tamiae Th239 TaxID=1094558 RepID=J1JZM4_9HYPH|nr:c-type cytochrome biogenesis protein CcmI [Bartonella tamiae]EJF90582.1 cytochrome c-type biogenesis protein CcmI [Bartonella tamiae Th239]EJF94040.1 cytochrome c-type biogenesis protein CcmI [Bartonella tamiae Th307]